jgi:hypothetical protein
MGVTTRLQKRDITAQAVARKLSWHMVVQSDAVLVQLPDNWTDQILELGRGLARVLPAFQRGIE